MQKLVLLFLLVVASFYFNSCTICSCKKVACPPYQDAYLDQWIKTFSNKKTLFINSNLAVDTITLSPIDASIGNEANKGCMEGDKGCTAYLRIQSLEFIPSAPPKFSLYYDSFTGWDGSTDKQVAIRVREFSVTATGVADTGLIIRNLQFQTNYLPSISLDGKVFSNVQMIQGDTSAKLSGVFKIFLSKNSGLIAYEDYPSHNLWIRQ